MKTSLRVALAAAAVIAIVGTAAGAASAGADTTAPTAVATFSLSDGEGVEVLSSECIELSAGDGAAVVEATAVEMTELPAEIVEAINADTDALVAHLADQGITVSVTTDDQGVRTPDLDFDDAAVRAAVESYWTEQGMSVSGSSDGEVIAVSGVVEFDTPVPMPSLEATAAPVAEGSAANGAVPVGEGSSVVLSEPIAVNGGEAPVPAGGSTGCVTVAELAELVPES